MPRASSCTYEQRWQVAANEAHSNFLEPVHRVQRPIHEQVHTACRAGPFLAHVVLLNHYHHSLLISGSQRLQRLQHLLTLRRRRPHC
jgi:hypothetical protein